MISFSHPTGNANVRAATVGLNNAGLLFEFNTSIAAFPGGLLDKIGGIAALAEIRRRRFDPSLKSITKTWPWGEIGRIVALKAGLTGFTKHETGRLSIDAVYHRLDKHVADHLHQAAKRAAKSVYAYEDGALSCFTRGHQLGMQCLYDLPIGYWRAAKKILEAERLLKPDWAPTIDALQDSDEKLLRKDDELRLASHIFVASRFTAVTLLDYPGKLAPVHVIPYGFPPVAEKREYRPVINKRKLKLLFVGGLSQRKGIAEVFAVADKLKAYVELTVVGRKAGSQCGALDNALNNHRWIPSLPNASILELMGEHDVLLFPSLFEGFGLVITEAMSQGTPVITTARTVGPDIITDGVNGWLVEPGSTPSLQTAVEKILSGSKIASEAGIAARDTASRRPWSEYGRELAGIIAGL